MRHLTRHPVSPSRTGRKLNYTGNEHTTQRQSHQFGQLEGVCHVPVADIDRRSLSFFFPKEKNTTKFSSNRFPGILSRVCMKKGTEHEVPFLPNNTIQSEVML